MSLNVSCFDEFLLSLEMYFSFKKSISVSYTHIDVYKRQGYIVACVDGRGTGFKGTKFKKVTYMNLGKYEIEDQIAAAKWLGMQSYIDKDRIGIFGWSFGGYMASLALTKGADVFKTGIAVAPVTNCLLYTSRCV